jgi:4'-phosphopantetheinyl transferase
VPTLYQGEVHIWAVDLDLPEGELASRRRWLSAEERARAGRFHCDVDRRRYQAHKGALREILGGYLGLQPAEIRFGLDRRGKPHVAGPYRDGLVFGVSHSGGLGLVGIRRGGQVGVDVERIIHGFDWREVAATALSEREVSALGALPTDQQCEAFFAIWTRKEALAKGIGVGLGVDLAALEVPTAPGLSGWSVSRVGADGLLVECSLVDLSPGAGYRAALALVGPPALVQCFAWATAKKEPGTRIPDSRLGNRPGRTAGVPVEFLRGNPVASTTIT